MNKRIQTPLVSHRFYKSLGIKVFVVSSNSLAKLMWRGYDLHCEVGTRNTLPAIDDLVVIECRIAGRRTCSYRVGYVKHVDTQTLTLCYDDGLIRVMVADWSIPMRQVKRIWSVNKIVRWYARMEKFYPIQSVNNYPA